MKFLSLILALNSGMTMMPWTCHWCLFNALNMNYRVEKTSNSSSLPPQIAAWLRMASRASPRSSKASMMWFGSLPPLFTALIPYICLITSDILIYPSPLLSLSYPWGASHLNYCDRSPLSYILYGYPLLEQQMNDQRIWFHPKAGNNVCYVNWLESRATKRMLPGALWQKSFFSKDTRTAHNVYKMMFDLPAYTADDCESKAYPSPQF